MNISSYSLSILVSFVTVFGGLTYLISWWQNNNSYLSKNYYLLANRNLSFWESSFSIAATWIWAPALFISSQKAYLNGWQGLFWFLVPNVLCLVIFSYFAEIIKKKYPQGFTLSDVISKIYSKRVQNVYWFTLIGLTVCAFAVQLLAGGKLISGLLDIPYWLATVIIALIPLGYSLKFGLKSSILTDFIKMIVILSLGVILVPLVLFNLGGIDSVINGLGGVKGNFLSPFSNDSLMLFLTFGLPTAIGLISGPFGDQSFWQRAFATRTESVKKSFITGAFLFGLVPLMMGIIGFAAAGSGLTINDIQMVNLETISSTTGVVGSSLFLLIVMSALTSIIDSKLCSVSSIIGHDLSNRFNIESIFSARISMIVLTLFALIIANLPGLQILYLFLFYGTLRSSTFIITVLTLLGKKLSEFAVFYGIISAILIGLPLFTYGNITKNTTMIVAGSLSTLLLPYISTLVKRS